MNTTKVENHFKKVCVITSTLIIYIHNHDYVTCFPDSSGLILARSTNAEVLGHVSSKTHRTLNLRAKYVIISLFTYHERETFGNSHDITPIKIYCYSFCLKRNPNDPKIQLCLGLAFYAILIVLVIYVWRFIK